ncbi:PPC domain-containing DNA-binding protein [Natronorarus salvus]|uniref:PPC domain-containing DNA-binding protein n=1 Tax=Natronorarus salvus TaxID=3117733 RepID=UPI002F26BAED
MKHRAVETTREFVARFERGAEWRAEIETLAVAEAVDAGVFFAYGTVSDAEVLFYDQRDERHERVVFDEPLTVTGCVGSISWIEREDTRTSDRREGDEAEDDGHEETNEPPRTGRREREVRTYATFARPSGQALAGRLQGATVLTGECYLRAFDDSFERVAEETGLDTLDL